MFRSTAASTISPVAPTRRPITTRRRRSREPDGWNTEALIGDPVDAVHRLKEQPGEGLYVGGVTLPLALANAGLIDEYEFVVYPMVIGRGPRLFDGLAEPLNLRPVGVTEFASGTRAERYVPVRAD